MFVAELIDLFETYLILMITYIYNILEQFQREWWTQIALQRWNNKVQLTLLDVSELHAIYLLWKNID